MAEITLDTPISIPPVPEKVYDRLDTMEFIYQKDNAGNKRAVLLFRPYISTSGEYAQDKDVIVHVDDIQTFLTDHPDLIADFQTFWDAGITLFAKVYQATKENQ